MQKIAYLQLYLKLLQRFEANTYCRELGKWAKHVHHYTLQKDEYFHKDSAIFKIYFNPIQPGMIWTVNYLGGGGGVGGLCDPPCVSQ